MTLKYEDNNRALNNKYSFNKCHTMFMIGEM